MSTNDSGIDVVFPRQGLTEEEPEREELGARMPGRSRKRASAARALGLYSESRRNSTEQCLEVERVSAERKEMNKTEQCHKAELP